MKLGLFTPVFGGLDTHAMMARVRAKKSMSSCREAITAGISARATWRGRAATQFVARCSSDGALALLLATSAIALAIRCS